nr:RpiB/LacA/LacB family sugar-phosphate isomerase [Rhizobium sp. L9]
MNEFNRIVQNRHQALKMSSMRKYTWSDLTALRDFQAPVSIFECSWVVVDIGPTTPESTSYPTHGEAAARLVASGDCRFGIILCGTGQGSMMAANKVKGIRCGVCGDTFSSPNGSPAQRCKYAFAWRARGGRRASA